MQNPKYISIKYRHTHTYTVYTVILKGRVAQRVVVKLLIEKIHSKILITKQILPNYTLSAAPLDLGPVTAVKSLIKPCQVKGAFIFMS